MKNASTRLVGLSSGLVVRCPLAVLLIVMLGFSHAQEQSKLSRVEGTIRDSSGRVVPKAIVSLQRKTPALSLATHTDANGGYVFSSLVSGSYIVSVEIPDAGQAQFGPFALASDEVKTVDLILSSRSAAASMPAFYDEPQFTVAGITQTGSGGAHGSDAVQRTSDALAKATASLNSPSQSASPLSENAGDLERDRAALRARLTQEDSAELHHLLAKLDERLSNPLEAVHEYQRAAELQPSEEYLFDWGAELLAHRAAEPAAQVFLKGNHLFPRSERMLVGLAVAQYTRGSYDAAARSLFEASDLNPSDSNPYLFLGKMLGVETSELHGFTMKFQRFAKLEPDNALANYYYAVSLWKESQVAGVPQSSRETTSDKTKKLLEKSIELDLNLSQAYLQLGIIASESNDLQQAISNYQKAAETDPASVEAHYRLAQAYRRAGRKDEAEQELKSYRVLSKQRDAESERERREIQQFVITLRNSSSSTLPK